MRMRMISVFAIYKRKTPNGVYFRLLTEFQKILTIVGLDQRKEARGTIKGLLEDGDNDAKIELENRLGRD